MSKASCEVINKERPVNVKLDNELRKIYALLTKRAVKMAGYWPSSFLAFLCNETKSRSIKTQKKERRQYPAILTEQAWSMKDLLYGLKITSKNFAFAATEREIPSGQNRPILPARVANQNTGFAV